MTFVIDSVSTVCYGDYNIIDSWEDKTLFVHGPDIIVFGRLINKSEEPLILDLYEDYNIDNPIFIDDPIFQELVLNISYRYKKDVSFFQDPLYQTDIMSYPYLNGIAPTISSTMIDGKSYSCSIIKGRESIPIAFETLSVPEDRATSSFRKTIRRQKKIAKAVERTITVTPAIRVVKQDVELSDCVLTAILSSNTEDRQFDSDNSVPIFFFG